MLCCCSAALRQGLNGCRLTFGFCLCLTGPSSGGLVYDHQPKWWPPCVVIPRQIPASVGEDQGAHHPRGGAGDGEVEDRVNADSLTAHSVFMSLNDRVFISTGARSRVWGELGQRRCACGECSVFNFQASSPYLFYSPDITCDIASHWPVLGELGLRFCWWVCLKTDFCPCNIKMQSSCF